MSANSTELLPRDAPAPPIEGKGELVTAAAQGESAAFTELYETYGRNVYNLVLRSTRDPATAEDLCQEIWVKAYRQLRELREPGAFATWLYRIASRTCVDHARRRPLATMAELPERPSDEPGPEAQAVRHEQEGLAWEALAALPARQQVALFLREVEDRNYAEIATIMETTEPAVETLLFRARRGLASAYERLQLAMPERCGQARAAMATLLDGEATPVQRRALVAHVDACATCRGQVQGMRRASAAYALVPLMPVPFLAHRVLEAAAGSAVASGGGAIAKLLSLAATKAPMIAITATVAGGVATGVLVAPRDAVPPPAPSFVSSGANTQDTRPLAPGTGASERAQDAPALDPPNVNLPNVDLQVPQLILDPAAPLEPLRTVVEQLLPDLSPFPATTNPLPEAVPGVPPLPDTTGPLPDTVPDLPNDLPAPDGIDDAIEQPELPPVALPLPTPTPPALPDLGLPRLP